MLPHRSSGPRHQSAEHAAYAPQELLGRDAPATTASVLSGVGAHHVVDPSGHGFERPLLHRPGLVVQAHLLRHCADDEADGDGDHGQDLQRAVDLAERDAPDQHVGNKQPIL